METVKNLIQKYYQIDREITDDEARQEVEALKKKDPAFIHDDKQRRLYAALEMYGYLS